MNNQQFRRLVADQPLQKDADEITTRPAANYAASLARRPGFVGLAPRNVKRTNDNFSHHGDRPAKKFKSSAPRGSAMAKGFVDRAKARAEVADDAALDDKATRIQVLEKQMKEGDLDMDTFERMREEITAGDVGSTHLIKGLDRKLLDRVRRGEDVLGLQKAPQVEDEREIDKELDRLEDVEIQAVEKGKIEKKGQTAIGSKKQSRDEIMAALKAQRKAAAAISQSLQAEEPALDVRWRRVDEDTKSRIEIDHKGREVLITVDADGVVKKRVRKLVAPQQQEVKPDASKTVLGDDIAVAQGVPAPTDDAKVDDDDDDDDDDNIFEDAGTDYDPLGSEQDSDADGDAGREEGSQQAPVELKPVMLHAKRNYFNVQPSAEASRTDHLAGVKAIIAKATKLSQKDEAPAEGDADAARRARHADMLANRDRDLEDMDLGFGASRHEDGEDAEGDGAKVRFSEWRGSAAAAGDDDDDGQDTKPERGHDKKKRKPKKRKGDASNIADIMTVIERRKDKK